MPGRKMSMVASLCAKPSKWARPVTTPTTSTTVVTPPTPTAAFVNPHGSLSLSLALNNSSRGVRTIKLLPCARLVSNKYDNNSLCNNSNNNSNKALALGFTFRGRNNKNKYHSLFSRENFTLASSSFSSSSSSSSAHKSGGLPESDSPSAGQGVVADMGSEDKVDDVDWYHHDDDHRRNDPNSPSSVSSPLQKHLHQQSHSKFLTLPTVLTLARVAAVPLLVCTFYVDTWWGRTATTSIFIAAAITDWLDGYLARKMRLGSAFGAFLDPVADKLMVAATLVLLCSRPLEVAMFGQMPWLLTVPSIAIIGREITMSAVREWAASQNGKLSEAVAVNNLGKWKTATQMTALIILLATRDSSLGGAGILVASGVILLYISAGLSVWSLAVYMSRIWSVLLK